MKPNNVGFSCGHFNSEAYVPAAIIFWKGQEVAH
jgi:hypothetical protein